jgi:predicted dehydrogenase
LLTIRNAAGERHEVVEGHPTYVHQLEAFVAAIRDNRRIATSGADSVVNMRLIDEVYGAAGLPRRGSPNAVAHDGLIKEAALK